MISYAQNREDVVLARAFGDQVRGLYIDVGAGHPVLDSVTKHFYDRGWRGINIEPSRGALALLEEARPEDINLGVGVADFEGKATFFEGPPDNHGSSTFRSDIAERYGRLGQDFSETPDVPMTTLALICEEYVGDRVIDLLKIDVEGLEKEAIAGWDWERWRPRVVVVEATSPNSRTPSHEAWEPKLLAAGYGFALFDGLNRFYARGDEPALLQELSIPACVFDDFADYVPMHRLEAMTAERDSALAQLAERGTAMDLLERRTAEAERQLRDRDAAIELCTAEARQAERARRLMEDRVRHAEDETIRAELGSAILRDRLSEESAARLAAERAGASDRVARDRAEQELGALLATRTFRWVAPLRRVYALLRKL